MPRNLNDSTAVTVLFMMVSGGRAGGVLLKSTIISTVLSVLSSRLLRLHQTASSLTSSSVCVLFLFVFPVFCFSNTISLTRDELLNIRQNTPQNILPDFDYSDTLLDIIVGGAAVLFRSYRMRRWGKRAGALVKLRQRGLRTPLPSIHLANLRSLPNKTDELLLLSRTNKDFSNSAALCFTETWLNDTIPDSALHLLPTDQSRS